MSRAEVFGLYPETLIIGSGVTASIAPLPGQNSAVLKWGAGGSLVIIGSTTMTQGSTFASAREYVVGTTESVNVNTAGRFFLLAVGATVTCYLLRGQTEGFSQ